MTPTTLQLGARRLDLRFSPRAARQLQVQRDPLDIEMELYFSCLIRKRLVFHASARADAAARARLTDRVSVSFRPVMTKACSVRDVVGAPDVETMALVRPAAFTPKWLALDYVRGQWSGEYGF